jgi:hypothetical protein
MRVWMLLEALTSPDALPRIDLVTLPAEGCSLDQFTDQKQVPRMRQMLPGPQTKLDRTAKLGKNQVAAHKLIGLMEIPMDPPEWLQIWTVWTVVYDRVYSITFTVRRAEVGKWKDYVARISRSLVFSRPVPNKVLLTPYAIKEPSFAFVRPADWTIDVSKSARGALAIFTHSSTFTGPEGKDVASKCSITVASRKNVAGDTLEAKLEQARQDICTSLDVQSPKVESMSLGDGKALVLEYQSDVVEKGGRYRQVILGNAAAPQDPILLFTMQSNHELDDTTKAVFDAVQTSITLAKDSHPPSLEARWLHLGYSFSLNFDNDTWTSPPDIALPKTELFLVGKGSRETPPTFTVLVRQVEPGEEVPLDMIIEGILDDLQKMCDESFEIVSREEMTVASLPGKATRVITKGSSRNQVDQVVEVRNAHTVFFDEPHNLVCVMAFSATPPKWEPLWPNAQRIIESLKFTKTA